MSKNKTALIIDPNKVFTDTLRKTLADDEWCILDADADVTPDTVITKNAKIIIVSADPAVIEEKAFFLPLKLDSRTSKIPIISISRTRGDQRILEGVLKGVVDVFFTQDIDCTLFLSVIDTFFKYAFLEMQLSDSKNLMETIYTSLEEAVTIVKYPERIILDCNPACKRTLGYSRDEMVGQNTRFLYFNPSDYDQAGDDIQKCRINNEIYEGEWKFRRKNGDLCHVEITLSKLIGESDISGKYAAVFRDITRRKEIEERKNFTGALYMLFSKKKAREDCLKPLVLMLQEISGCRAVGIKTPDSNDNLIIKEQSGYSIGFLDTEKWLSLSKDECICTRIAMGKIEPQDASFITEHGSFYMKNAKKAFELLSENGRAKFRVACVKEGFLSIAVVPIKYKEKILGVIHFADETEGIFSTDFIEFLEEIGFLIGQAFYDFDIEEQFARSNRRNKMILDSAGEGIFGIDEESKINFVNPSAMIMTGFSEKDFLGKTLEETVRKNPENRSESRIEDRNIDISMLGAESIMISDEVFWRKDETCFSVEYVVTPIFEDKKIVGAVMIFSDISERRMAETALRLARDELENRVKERTSQLESMNENLKAEILERVQMEGELQKAVNAAQAANKAKSAFLANMSHELRTPLNGILGFSDLLKAQFFGPLNEKQIEYVSQIDYAGKHLLAIINDILDISKIDAGSAELQLEEFSAQDFMEATLAMVRVQFKKKEYETEIKCDPNLRTIYADRRKLRQILLNLLSNAGKFTPPKGKISIIAEVDAGSALISVQDSGIGISKEEQSKIFSEFYQVQKVRDEALGGTGIGLALSKRLIQMHGGQIGVESEPDKGSRFWFKLPLKSKEPSPGFASTTKDSESLQYVYGRKILVAEDSDSNISLILDMLKIHDHSVSLAKTGQEAIDLAISTEPELIFMDLKMPVLDGFEATRRLRTLPKFSKTPILALTASLDVVSKQDCLTSGCDEVVSKPIESKELFRILFKYLGKNPSTKS